MVHLVNRALILLQFTWVKLADFTLHFVSENMGLTSGFKVLSHVHRIVHDFMVLKRGIDA